MVTIKFELSQENLSKAGYTDQKIINFLHNFYVVERKATEIGHLVFQRVDEDTMCNFGDIISVLRGNPKFMSSFSKCEWDIDGEEEDILAEIKDYEKRYSR